MQSKLNIFICIGSILLMSVDCIRFEQGCHSYILMNNYSNNKIYVDAYVGDSSLAIYAPDANDSYVNPGVSNEDVVVGYSCFETAFKDENAIDTLYVFIYSAKLIEEIPLDTIRANYWILKRFELSLSDLDRLDWTITYEGENEYIPDSLMSLYQL